jgi:hypothetical protein
MREVSHIDASDIPVLTEVIEMNESIPTVQPAQEAEPATTPAHASAIQPPLSEEAVQKLIQSWGDSHADFLVQQCQQAIQPMVATLANELTERLVNEVKKSIEDHLMRAFQEQGLIKPSD